jgi:cytosine/adenosine deaminase-related metal-dependent hydrolase
MQTYISADIIFPVSSKPIKNGVIKVNEAGEIIAVYNTNEAKNLGIKNIKKYQGMIIPGFINTHCHLELSHLRDKIEEKTGLPNFIKQVLAQRAQAEEDISAAMEKADQEMFNNGIVAVGDISNLPISKSIKLKSSIYYHTFIEVLGFNRPSEPIIDAALKLKQDFEPLKASIVPHAPYSVSTSLFNEIKKVTSDNDILSIHNQETQSETELFEKGTGSFADFFAAMNIAQNKAHASGQNSIQYHLPQLAKNVNTLLVHNTFSSKADVKFATEQHRQLYWCLCPNANLYIENTLPDIDLLIDENVKITLGTDSLASNHQLNILAEMGTLQTQKNISFEKLLSWATLNGAEFLGIDSEFGSIDVGKKPGLLLLKLSADLAITKSTTIKRLY